MSSLKRVFWSSFTTGILFSFSFVNLKKINVYQFCRFYLRNYIQLLEK